MELKQENQQQQLQPETEEQQRALKAAAAYARLLRVRHPQWSEEKLQRKVTDQLAIKIV